LNEALTWLTEPFQYPFMLRALWASLIVGVVCPVLGTYVVLRGMAFLGDALAHIILPGVVLAFLLGLPLALGALAVGVLAALAINAISARAELREDAAIGVVFAGAFALLDPHPLRRPAGGQLRRPGSDGGAGGARAAGCGGLL